MKKLSRLIIPVLVLAISGGVFMLSKMTARADDPPTDPPADPPAIPTVDITGGDNGNWANYYFDDTEMGGKLFVIASDNYNPATNTYIIDENGDPVYDINSGNPISYHLGNITVPDGCTLTIDALDANSWTFNSTYTGTINVESGGCLAIFGATINAGVSVNIADGGSLNLFGATIPNTVITPQGGACINIDHGFDNFPNNLPTGLTAYHWDGQTEIQADELVDPPGWVTLTYNGTAGHWAWDDLPMGKPDLVDDCRAYIFAYTGPYDKDTFRTNLATELYNRFFDVNMYDFGWYSDGGNRTVNIERIKNVIELPDTLDPPSGHITPFNNNNVETTRNYYTATVHWGVDEEGNTVESTIPVFVLNNPQEFLVCTDQNFSTGMGSNYFVRTVHTDQTTFAEGTQTFGDHNMEEYVILTNNIGNVVIGGDGASFDVFNTEGMYSAQIYKYSFETSGIPGNEYGGFVRVLNPSDTYIAVISDGEPYKTDGMALNGFPTDNVWEAGDNASAKVFIGDTTIYIEPLNQLPGYGYNAITDVSLADETQRDGVEINKTDLTRVSVTFKSNFYDSVPLSITYAGGVTRTLIIERIGLVMRYLYLYDDRNVGTINCDCNPDATHTFNYNYAAGENILVYATYYHPTNYTTASGGNDLYLNIQYENGNQRIIGHTDAARDFNGYSPAGNGAVATTTFLIDIIPGGNDASTTYPAFYATVMNAGFNDDTTYGGTQTGSGKGVYWDGHIYWIRRGL